MEVNIKRKSPNNCKKNPTTLHFWADLMQTVYEIDLKCEKKCVLLESGQDGIFMFDIQI